MSLRILTGHVLDRLAELSDESVHCVVTSPPYWGLRDYGTEPQVWGGISGCAHEWSDLIEVNATNHVDKRRWQHTRNGREEQPTDKRVAWLRTKVPQGAFCCLCEAWCGSLGLEPSYQLYVDHLVAVFDEIRRVLRADGVAWLNLGDCYATGAGKVGDRPGGGKQGDRWTGYRGSHSAAASGKQAARIAAMGPMTQPNRMPQPGLKPKDIAGVPWRVAFALQDAGWWLRQDNIFHKRNPMPESVKDRTTRAHEYVFHLTKAERYWYDAAAVEEPLLTDPRENYPARARVTGRGDQGFAAARGHDRDKSGGFPVSRDGRNRRSVWTVATSPTEEAHFATMPEEIAEICILAGCPVGGTVLDPFLGSGTTAMVAERLARDSIGIELHPGYVSMSERRTRQPGLALIAAE